MTQYTQDTVLLPSLAAAAMLLGILGVCTLANGDDSPPAGAAPGQRHHNPAWEACKKQADDQKLQPGDARRDFMKSCMKSATPGPSTPPPTA